MATVLDRPPTRRRFDVDAYYRMAEAGILPPDARVELIEGEIVDMAPIGSGHAGHTNRLNRLANAADVREVALVAVQVPLRLDRANEPQPDLMLLRPRADDYTSSHPGPADVLLLIEIADSLLAFDRGTKLLLYARHDVREVWIVDLPNRAIEVCREPRGGANASRERVGDGRIAASLVPAFAVEVGEAVGG